MIRAVSSSAPRAAHQAAAQLATSSTDEPSWADPVLERARQGDPQAFGELYERHAAHILGFFCRRLNDPDIAADLTADVFMRVHQAIQNGHPWQESFVSWLFQIARYRLIDHVRFVARRPQCELMDSLPGANREQLDDWIDQRLVIHEVDTAIGRLRPDYAQILRLRFHSDLTHAESGALLNKRESAVKVTHHRAVKALRKQLVGNPVAESWSRMAGQPALA
jgi:RNA polymerase sigma-70 factor (ECF subfamily)